MAKKAKKKPPKPRVWTPCEHCNCQLDRQDDYLARLLGVIERLCQKPTPDPDIPGEEAAWIWFTDCSKRRPSAGVNRWVKTQLNTLYGDHNKRLPRNWSKAGCNAQRYWRSVAAHLYSLCCSCNPRHAWEWFCSCNIPPKIMGGGPPQEATDWVAEQLLPPS